MAVNTSRNMNAELREGLTDGSYKKVVNNRGGVVERATYDSRNELDDVWYGIHEVELKDIKTQPGHNTTPYYVPTAMPDSTKW